MSTRTLGALVLGALAALPGAAQPRPARAVVEVPFKFLSAEIVRFPEPLRTAGPKAPGLSEAFLVKVEVDPKLWSSLPPDVEPFLYVGALELRTFASDAAREGRTLTLTYWSADVEAAGRTPDAAAMVLTMDHGAPVRDPGRFAERPDVARFRKELLTDKR